MSTSLTKWLQVEGDSLAKQPPKTMRRTKIIATIGPVTQSVEKLSELIDAGVNVFRLNFSHGDHAYHKKTIENIREAIGKKRRQFVAICLDTKGPEIRTGLTESKGDVELKVGQKVIVTTDDAYAEKTTSERIYVDYKNITKVLKPGNNILIDDGLIKCVVDSIGETEIQCTVANSGMLGSRKGVNLPGVKVDLPAVTARDRKDLKFGVRMGVDFIAASFIRKAEDVREIRKVLGTKGSGIMIISKIENAEGLENYDSILEETDAVMVARGDMGVEIPLEQVSLAQKMMIAKANVAGKPVITATQMLESMVVNPRPNRSEIADISNAVLDGTDAVMLSGETAKGNYPVECVKTMARICVAAESSLHYDTRYQNVREAQMKKSGTISITETISSSAVKMTNDVNAALLLTITESGNTARLVAKYRPKPPIFSITQNKETARQLCLSWNVTPVLVGSVIGTDSIVKRTIMLQQEAGIVNKGDLIVVTSGMSEGTSGSTNVLRVFRAGEGEKEDE